MSIITRYILRSFVVSLLASLVTLTFMMSISYIFKLTDLIAKGLPLAPILQILLYSIPMSMVMAVPISILVSALLVFGRLSADGEITAMRASGISIWTIAISPLILGTVLSLLCLYINHNLAPLASQQRNELKNQLGAESLNALLEVGQFQGFNNTTIYVGSRDDNFIYDVRIYDKSQTGLRREILAKKGHISVDKATQRLDIDLFIVRITPAPGMENKPESALECDQWPFSIENAFKRGPGQLKEKDMPSLMILTRLNTLAQDWSELPAKVIALQRMKYLVELNKRMVLSVACLAFILLGLPLGIKAHRKESSVGIAVSLALVLGFYLLVILAETLADYPATMPHIIIWVPAILSLSIGGYLIRRAN